LHVGISTGSTVSCSQSERSRVKRLHQTERVPGSQARCLKDLCDTVPAGSLAAAAGIAPPAGSFVSAEAPQEMQAGSNAAGPPASNRFAAPRRTGVRSRYVDTMNAGRGGGALAGGGGASVGLASLVPKPAFAPPAGEQSAHGCEGDISSSMTADDRLDIYALPTTQRINRSSHLQFRRSAKCGCAECHTFNKPCCIGRAPQLMDSRQVRSGGME